MTPVVVGRLISLARPDPRFFPLAASWINDHEIGRTLITGVPWPITTEEVAYWLPTTFPLTAFFIWPNALLDPPAGEDGAAQPAESRPVGLCHFHTFDRAAKCIKLAILLEPSAQGRGFGSEAVMHMLEYAFSTFDLNRVALSAFSNNPGGLRAYARAGFKTEGVRRRAWYRDGEWLDDVLMAVLRRDWEARLPRSEEPG